MRLTYDTLETLEPRLKEAEALALKYAGENNDFLWFYKIRPAFKNLVGYGSSHPDPVVRSGKAYQVAHSHILAVYDQRRPADEG